MIVRLRWAERTVSAAKCVVAVVGMAGCTSTPTVATVSPDSPSALVRHDVSLPKWFASADASQTGSSHAAMPDSVVASTRANRTILNDAGRRTAPPVSDPFVVATAGSTPLAVSKTAAKPATANRNVASNNAISVSQAAATDTRNRVQPVAYAEPGMVSQASQPRTRAVDADGAAGVSRVKDLRLPPAPSLSASTPFSRSAAARARTMTDATPVANQPAARRSATRRVVDFTPVSGERPIKAEKSDSPIPITAFLTGELRLGSETAPAVANEDMIVDSAILSKRSEWRGEIVPTRLESMRSPFPIMPRRPFAAPDWDGSGPSANANRPVSIRTATTQTVSATGRGVPAMPAIELDEVGVPPITPPVVEMPTLTVTDIAVPMTSAQEPFKTETFSEFQSQFAAAAEPPVEAAETTTVASMPVLTIAPPPPADPAAPVAAKPAKSEGAAPAKNFAYSITEKSRLGVSTTGVANKVEPVDITQADLAAAKANAEADQTVTAPVVIGIALMLVAAGTVFLRRRLT